MVQAKGSRSRARTWVSLVGVWSLVISGAALADPGDTETEVASKSYLGAVDKGHYVAFKIKPAFSSIEVEEKSVNVLDSQAAGAVARAPQWLQHQLREIFRGMNTAKQQKWAKAILDASAQTVDEVAFLIAHLSAEDRSVATPTMVAENAQAIYDIDPLLKYADLVEKGTPGKDKDYYTTIKYHVLRSGKAATFELPRDIYYWWVVHPFLDMEYYRTINPNTGQDADPPAGLTWRKYFLAKMDTALSPRKHFIMKSPNVISDKELAAYNFGAAKAYASLGPTEVGGDEVIRGGSAGAPVLIHYSPPGGTCNATQPMPDGVFLYTTIPLEQAAENGAPELLENLLEAGAGRATLRTFDVVVHSPQQKENRGVLIVRDRIPFGGTTDPNETALTKYKRTYKVMTSAEFDALVQAGQLSSSAKPYINYGYNKIVVPSDQPRALYQIIANHKAEIAKFVKYSGVFQMHGATGSKDDWSDLTMPGGIKSTKQTSANYLQSLQEYGNALLRDVMTDVQYLWTGVRRCSRFAKTDCPPGNRKMKAGDDAIDRVGWWSGQMLDRSVGEIGCLHGVSKPERSWYPQRIVPNHYGNCGEIQDVVGAASRAALIPSMLTHSLEDHVWNEFYAGDGQWYPYDTGWSDAPMRIGAWNVSGDGDSGGGKENAVMIGWRGDGRVVNLLGRYKALFPDSKIDYEYTQWLEVTITVRDANGAPVDGAVVTLLTEYFYSASMAVRGIFGVTDRAGKVTLKVGDKRNFYINISSELGHFPKKMDLNKYFVDMHEFVPLIQKSEAKAGAKISKEFVLSGKNGDGIEYQKITFPTATLQALPKPKSGAAYHRVQVDLKIPAEFRHSRSTLNYRYFLETVTDGEADLYVMDRANYDKFKAGQDFSASVIKEGISAAAATPVDLADAAQEYYVVVANQRKASFAQLVQATLKLSSVIPPSDPGQPPPQVPLDEGCDCSLGTSPSPFSLGSGLLCLALVWAAQQRRRRRRKV